MSLRQWLICKINYELDVKGIIVALAVLIGVSVFSGNRDSQSLQEDRQSHPSSMGIESTENIGTIKPIQPSYRYAKPSSGLDASPAESDSLHYLTTPVAGADDHYGR